MYNNNVYENSFSKTYTNTRAISRIIPTTTIFAVSRCPTRGVWTRLGDGTRVKK